MSLQILFGGQVENAKSLSEIKANNHENMEIISILSKLLNIGDLLCAGLLFS